MKKEQEDSIFALLLGSYSSMGEEGANYTAKRILERIKEILEEELKILTNMPPNSILKEEI